MEVVRNVASGRGKAVVRKRTTAADVIAVDPKLKKAMSVLPSNYNFEIEKTISRIHQFGSKLVALQFPEGLLIYACVIEDIIQRFTEAKVVILGDVTFGACCIDDYTAEKLGVDLLIHYGHSCLVPLQITRIKVMYVFVEIYFDTSHLVETIKKNFPKETSLAIMGTIQFASCTHSVRTELKEHMANVVVPQCKPLSPGETLGCTSPLIPDCAAVVFVADGRFHLESAMIQNPTLPMFKYDPYNKILSREGYDFDLMRNTRRNCIQQARQGRRFGLILGTLGRQGNVLIFNRLKKLLAKHNKTIVPFLMAEINPKKLALIKEIDVWVQVACPRLSIDWGLGFDKPLLSSYEVQVMLGEAEWRDVYPMDYYSREGGSWTNYYKEDN